MSSSRIVNSSPPEPGHGVAGPNRGLQGRAQLHEQAVAHAVAEAVVDELEAVDVQEHHREHALVVAARHRALEAAPAPPAGGR
jgi:hypothetical protein